jgi:hypothetical protein
VSAKQGVAVEKTGDGSPESSPEEGMNPDLDFEYSSMSSRVAGWVFYRNCYLGLGCAYCLVGRLTWAPHGPHLGHDRKLRLGNQTLLSQSSNIAGKGRNIYLLSCKYDLCSSQHEETISFVLPMPISSRLLEPGISLPQQIP